MKEEKREIQWRKRKREGEHEIEGGKEGEKLDFVVCAERERDKDLVC